VIAARVSAIGAFLCASYLALVAWMHGVEISALFTYDTRISVPVFVFLSLAFAAWGVRIWRRGQPPTRVAHWTLGFLVLFSIATSVGRFRLLMSVYSTGGSRAERDAHDAARLLLTAQEDFRVRTGGYASGTTNLDDRILRHVSPSVALQVTEARSDGWVGKTTHRKTGLVCRVRVLSRGHALSNDNHLEDDVRCDGGEPEQPPPIVAPLGPVGIDSAPGRELALTSASWPQERFDAARSGIVSSTAFPVSWRVDLHQEFRAVASIVGNRVLVGAHGSGWLAALDRRTGAIVWHTRVPNWIHQNPVAANGIVVVGVGDKLRRAGSKIGLGISGVYAADLRDGSLRWFERTSGSVMIAPAISGNTVVYGDGHGTLWARSLSDGVLMWRRPMRGVAVMASPAIVDSVVYMAQAPRSLCAYDVASGAERWCHDVSRGLLLGGDPTPSVIGGAVYWSVAEPMSGVKMLLEGGRVAVDYVRDRLYGRARPSAQQWLFAIDARTGQLRWSRRLGGGHEAKGNIAGTAVGFAKGIVFVAPLAGRTVALDTATGAELWSTPSDAFSRGAVTVVDSFVIASDYAKHLHIIRSSDGSIACTASLPDALDRSGPAISGNTAFLTTLHGTVIAEPVANLLACKLSTTR
jgi:outer membrane protein assembly factor BamB